MTIPTPSHRESLVGKARVISPEQFLSFWRSQSFPSNETDMELLQKAKDLRQELIEKENESSFFVLCAPKDILRKDTTFVEEFLIERGITINCQQRATERSHTWSNFLENYNKKSNFVWLLQQFGQKNGFHYSEQRRVFSLLQGEQFTPSPFALFPFLLGLDRKILSLWDVDKSRWIGFLREESLGTTCLQFTGVNFSSLQSILEIQSLKNLIYYNPALAYQGGFATTIFVN